MGVSGVIKCKLRAELYHIRVHVYCPASLGREYRIEQYNAVCCTNISIAVRHFVRVKARSIKICTDGVIVCKLRAELN